MSEEISLDSLNVTNVQDFNRNLKRARELKRNKETVMETRESILQKIDKKTKEKTEIELEISKLYEELNRTNRIYEMLNNDEIKAKNLMVEAIV